MKKIKLLAIAVFVVILFTGCGSKTETLTCTNTQEASGVSMDQKIVMTFKNNKVSNLEMTVDSEAANDTIKDNWDIFATALDKQYPSKDKDGIKVSTTNNKDKHVYQISIKIDLTKADKKSLAEYDLEDIAGNKSSLDDVKKAAKDSGFTCK